jgi:hypothetical protein
MPKCKPVDVTVHLQVNDNPKFTFDTTLPKKGNKGDHLIFKKGGPDGFLISYHLDDPDHVYSFGNDLQEALYSTDQPVCPGPDEPCHWDQFQAVDIADNGMTLVVWNKNDPKNGDPMDFGYALRVIKEGDKKYLHLDPIGTNGNSNSSGGGIVVAAAVFVVAAAIGAIAAKAAIPLATQASVVAAALVVGVVAVAIYLLSSSGRVARAV